MVEQCGICKFWKVFCGADNSDVGEAKGECKRYPPVCIASEEDPTDNVTAWAQPLTVASDYCGEFTPISPGE